MPGWTFVETEDWRKDLEASWTDVDSDDGMASPLLLDSLKPILSLQMDGSIQMMRGWRHKVHLLKSGSSRVVRQGDEGG